MKDIYAPLVTEFEREMAGEGITSYEGMQKLVNLKTINIEGGRAIDMRTLSNLTNIEKIGIDN